MAHNNQTVDKLPFSMSSRVVMQLGRQSISDSIVAIIELVKNAYDADADNVWIRFYNIPERANPNDNEPNTEQVREDSLVPFMVIEDDGDGMTWDEVKDKWMVIGIDEKARNRKSSRNRTKVGEKGLGRLGLDRLCEVSKLSTFVSDSDGGVELEIDWRKYDDTSMLLSDIVHTRKTIEGKEYLVSVVDESYFLPKKNGKGTAIVLTGLRDRWISKDLDKLKNDLSLLMSPFRGKNDFQVHFTVNEKEELIQSSSILDAAEWEVLSELVQRDGEWYINLSMQGRGKPSFTNTQKWSTIFSSSHSDPQCGAIEFFLYFIPRKRISGDELSFSLNEVNNFMNANQGIRIYRDDFHVRPYGDPDGGIGDWLGLSYRKTSHPGGRNSGSWHASYNQFVGAIFIERERNQNLLDQTNREGIVKTKAFDDLRKYALHVISWFEDRDYEAQRYNEDNDQIDLGEVEEKAEQAAEDAEVSMNDLTNTVESVFDNLESEVTQGKKPDLELAKQAVAIAADVVKSKFKNSRSAQAKFAKASKEREEQQEFKLSYMANLASLGILSVAFGHETMRRISLVVENASLLEEDIEALFAVKTSEYYDVMMYIERIIRFGSQIESFAKFMLTNVERDKRHRVNVQLDKVVEDVFEVFDSALVEKRHIDVRLEWEAPPPPIRSFPIDWESILVNFITNSEYALLPIPRDDRIIRVSIDSDTENVYLRYADSGKGLPVSENWTQQEVDRFFAAGKSTKVDEDGNEIGTGMGLFIIRELVRSYNGTISAVPRCNIGGAEFVISIPVFSLGRRGQNNSDE